MRPLSAWRRSGNFRDWRGSTEGQAIRIENTRVGGRASDINVRDWRKPRSRSFLDSVSQPRLPSTESHMLGTGHQIRTGGLSVACAYSGASRSWIRFSPCFGVREAPVMCFPTINRHGAIPGCTINNTYARGPPAGFWPHCHTRPISGVAAIR
jgi:hypothetical protein